MDYNLIATSAFGLESVVAKELKSLGYDELILENGKVHFTGDELDIVIANIHLRTAERILINMGEFEARSFEELFQGTKAINWGALIPVDGKMHVTGKSVKSTLHSVPDCQSIVKKAIVTSMQEKYNRTIFSEDGPVYKTEISLLKDKATLSVDTSGLGLHKRGYREKAGEAPLKETLAAAMVLLSKWSGKETLIDPFCGSGTILIEAAMIARDMAPGLNRKFVSEEWPNMSKSLWDQVRDGARKSIKNNNIKLFGYDINGRLLSVAKDNARLAGVSGNIEFHKQDFKEFELKKDDVFIISNPPYGERIGEEAEIRVLYKKLGELKESNPKVQMNILTSYEDFQKLFGLKSDKNRKLYNGRLKCYYYEYFRK
ncbi:THUMP domain-containing class I SAM-dependent RNA methyltransferase [Clostridium paridis]|uniref:Class I SAM-dependent RNA methyltransferase n=1 Tax=Clostridium paridis TaxID=2803863 RepID=A0A937FFH1_9CLOT|nr:class I SAM-dependent RNA methyltransferase [Clostridium paridis]MBL4931038.1 class I SAM-dependent RNA methyltransferase [Clostridium paridis]